MTPEGRLKLQLLLSRLIGLELFAIGESEQPKTAEDDFMALRARLLTYEALLWHSTDGSEHHDEDSQGASHGDRKVGSEHQ